MICPRMLVEEGGRRVPVRSRVDCKATVPIFMGQELSGYGRFLLTG